MPRGVIHVVASAAPEATAIARIVRGFVAGLDPACYAPQVWFLDGGGCLAEDFRAGGVPVRGFAWGGVRGSPGATLRLVRALAAERPCWLHLHAGGGALPLLGRLTGAGRVLVHQHGRVRDEGAGGIEVFRARGAHAVVANSSATAACVRHPRVRVVHPGIPPDGGVVAPGGGRVPVIGTACRLVPVKGLRVLLEAFASVAAESPSVRLEVAGTGPDEGTLREAARALGVAGRVRFLGWVPDVASVARGWDLFVLPSCEEGFGLAAVEAMHLGLAVVASRVGGLPEVVQHGATGLLVPPGDADALAVAIGALLRAPARRRALGESGRRRAREHFSEQAMAAAMGRLYDELGTVPRRPGRSRLVP